MIDSCLAPRTTLSFFSVYKLRVDLGMRLLCMIDTLTPGILSATESPLSRAGPRKSISAASSSGRLPLHVKITTAQN